MYKRQVQCTVVLDLTDIRAVSYTHLDVYKRQPYYRTYTADTSAYSTGGLPNLVAISNDGNADAYPIIQLSGPLMGRSWELVNETTG